MGLRMTSTLDANVARLSMRHISRSDIQIGNPLFNPKNIPGLIAWFAADQISGVALGATVPSWNDLSVVSGPIIQGTEDNQPTLTANVKNALPAVLFDGSNDVLVNSAFPDMGDRYTVFCVAAQSVGGATGQGLVEVSTGSTNTGLLLFTNAGNTIWRVVDSLSTQDFQGGDRRNGLWYIHTGAVIDRRSRYFVNGTQASATPGALYTPPNPNTLSKLHVGILASVGTFKLTGYIGEILIYNTTLSDGDRSKVTRYLADKWDIALTGAG